MKPAFEGNEWKPDIAAMTRALNSDDPLVFLLRTHLEIERHLETLICNMTALDPRDVKGFDVKVKVLRAIGIPKWILGCCSLINRARNEVVHEQHYKLDKIKSYFSEMDHLFDENSSNKMNVDFVADDKGNIVPEEMRQFQKGLIQGFAICRLIAGLNQHSDAEKLRQITQGGGWKW